MQRKPRPRQTALREKVVKLVSQKASDEVEEDFLCKDSQEEDLFAKDEDFEQCLSQVLKTARLANLSNAKKQKQIVPHLNKLFAAKNC